MKFIQSSSFWAVLITLIVFGVAVAFTMARRTQPGFGDYVKQPQLWEEVEEAHSDVERAADVAKTWSADQVANAVRSFVLDTKSSEDPRSDAVILRSLGNRTHPALLQILRDPSLRSKLLAPTRENLLPEAPFNRVCQLLEKDPPQEVVAVLAPFLDEKSDEARKDAALVIGSVGSELIIAPVRKALTDADDYVRSYALMGLKRASENNRLSERCRRELFGDIQGLLSEGKNADHAAGLLLDFDQTRAIAFFLSKAMFAPDSGSLHQILSALNAQGVKVPRDRLLSLIDELEATELTYPKTYQLGEALHLLGMHQVHDDRTLLQKYVAHDEDIIAEGAAAGMLASHGLDGFQERIWKKIDTSGFTSLSNPQRHYAAVIAFDAEVNNGGLSQYFFNSSGNEWRNALAGLEAMQSKERLTILREALASFGGSGPAGNRDERILQLSRLQSANDALFDELDSRYYKSTEVIDVMAMHYVLQNVEAFR